MEILRRQVFKGGFLFKSLQHFLKLTSYIFMEISIARNLILKFIV